MFVAIWALNNITAHRLLTTCSGVPSDSYRHQISINFEKFIDLESKNNTSMIIAPILLVFRMHIGPTRFIKNSALNAEFDPDGRLRTGSTGLYWDDSTVAEAIATIEDDKDEEEDRRKKNKRLKREKQHQK